MKPSWCPNSLIMLTLSFALMACGTGDDNKPTDAGPTDTGPNIDVPSTGTTLKDINGLQAGLECHTSGEPAFLTLIDQVTVNGIVVVSPKLDAFTHATDDTKSLDGYYVVDQDGGANSGLLLTVARTLSSDFQIGDELNVQGEAMEYYCRTQFKALQVTPVSTGLTVTPTDINSEDLADPAKAELVEGSLVRITNAVVEEKLEYGQYKLLGGAIIDDDPFLAYEMSLEVGITIPELIGVVNYSYQTYTLGPRSADDVPGATIEDPPVASEKTVAEIQQEEGGLSCHETDPEPQFVNLSSGFAMKGIVVTMAKFDAYTSENDDSKSLDGYFVSDATGGPYSGVMMVVPRSMGTNLGVGATIDVKADGTEYYCNTQIKAFEVTDISTGATVAPVEVAGADLAAADTAEAYEGMLVTVIGGVIAEGPNEYGEYTLDSGTVIHDKYAGAALEWNIGETLTVTGIVHYGYWHYTLNPRSLDDVVVNTPPGGE